MAKYTFKSDLSVRGLKKLKTELLNYKSEFNRKVDLFVKKLLEVGIDTAQFHIDESPLGKYVTLSTEISSSDVGCKGILLAKGEIKENEGYAPFYIILAIEFGAGIYYNKIPHPSSNELGFGVGTFPNQIHAFEDMWFYWDEDEQKWKPTHGVKATMPMYNSSLAIKDSVIRVAKEVFN